MNLSGIAYLPLHDGPVPRWLFNRMVRLGGSIIKIIIDEYGTKEFIDRLSNPFWFQAFGCVLGFDWHSSGLTTVLTAVLDKVLPTIDCGVYIVGGKGKKGFNTPIEVMKYSDLIGDNKAFQLSKYSKLSAGIDTLLLQDGYILYHHAIVFDEDGNWVVIQQGMNPNILYARRYHISSRLLNENNTLLENVHSGFYSLKTDKVVLDLTAYQSRGNKLAIIDIFNSKNFKKLYDDVIRLIRDDTLLHWIDKNQVSTSLGGLRELDRSKVLLMPRHIDWRKVRKIYEERLTKIEELVLNENIDPKLVRAAALIAELIYGEPAQWRDPVRYTFTVGGKDGVPHPISREFYDEVIKFFNGVVKEIEEDSNVKREALKRLSRLERRIERHQLPLGIL